MFRTIIIILFLFICGTLYSKEADYPQYLIHIEYKTDNIDYDDTKKTYYKTKTAVKFSRQSSANIAWIFLKEKNEHRYTWNLSLLDISPYAEFIIGNYTVNFAAGLISGKKKYISSDEFSSSLVVSKDKTFKPGNSGNPLFSFRGMCTALKYNLSNFSFSLNLYYSIRDRFVKNETYVNNYTESSINSINAKFIEKYNYSETAKIIDAGSLLQIMYDNNFKIQFYYTHTNIEGSNNKTIKWNYDTDDSGGINSFFSYGIFGQYSDEYISLFTEYGLTYRELSDNKNNKKKVYDFGLLYGMKFRHQKVSFSMAGKHTGKKFYSLYSSGHNYPEKSWILNISIRPIRKLLFGTSLSSDKRLIPGYTKRYLPVIKREKFYLKAKPKKYIKLNFNFSRIEKELELKNEKKYQTETSIYLYPAYFINIKLFGSYQLSTISDPSAKIGTGMSFLFFKYFKFQIRYYKYFISKENSIYSKTAENLGLISSGSQIDRSINSIMVGLKFKYKMNRFSILYENKFINYTSISNRINLSGKLIF